MGNAISVLEKIEKRKNSKRGKAKKKDEEEDIYVEGCKVTVIKRCECCEKTFGDSYIYSKCKKSANNIYCEECRKSKNKTMRRQVRLAGGWREYNKIKEKMLDYNNPKLKKLSEDSLMKQREYRKRLGLSFSDITRILDSLGDENETFRHQRINS